MTLSRLLSRPQLAALRYVKGRSVFASELNSGNGNRRRTLLSLMKLKMIDWGPTYHQCLVLTDAGKQQLERDAAKKIAAKAALGRIETPVRRAVRRASKRWNGMCPAGMHGLDFEEQPCDLCAADPPGRQPPPETNQ